MPSANIRKRRFAIEAASESHNVDWLFCSRAFTSCSLSPERVKQEMCSAIPTTSSPALQNRCL